MAGQRLVVLPEQALVAVRMAVADGRVPEDVIGFPGFAQMVLKLVPPAWPASTR